MGLVLVCTKQRVFFVVHQVISNFSQAKPNWKYKMSVVGVDIGLQNSVIAAAGRGGVDVVLNGNSQRLNP